MKSYLLNSLLSIGLVYANFDNAVISKTYNVSSASIANEKGNEFFSIQGGYDYNTYHLETLDLPKSTEVSFWYYLPNNIELGLQFDRSMLYDAETMKKLYNVTSGIFSIYYHFKNTTLPIDVKIGGMYGELDVEGDGLVDISDYKEKTTGYGLSIYKKIILDVNGTKFLDLTPFIDFHILFNTNNTTTSNEILFKSNNTYLKNMYGLVVNLKKVQFTPYISYNDGDWISGWSASLLFNKY